MSTEPLTPDDGGVAPVRQTADPGEEARAATEDARAAAEDARQAAEEARAAAEEARRRHDADDARADEWEDESFPASDPPSNY